MLKRIFSPSSFGLATLIIGVATFVSYVAGFFRDVLITNFFGADGATDAYYAAITLVDNVYALTTAGALMGVLLPVFRRTYLKNKLEGERLMGSWMMFSQILVLLVSGIMFVFMSSFAQILYGSLSEVELDRVVFMARILLLSPILFTLSNSIGVVLHSFKHYLSFALSASFYNVGIIVGLILFYEQHGVNAIVYGTVIGLVLHVLIRLVDLFFIKDFNFAKGERLWFWHPELKQVLKLSIPKTMSLFTLQLTLLVYNMVGLGLEEGSISAFNYARNIQGFVVSMFGVSLATAVFPFLVDLRSEGEMDKLRFKIEDSILRIMVFALPAAVGLGVLSVDVVNILFNRGAFDDAALLSTSLMLTLFAVSICFESLNHLLIRVYNAFENTFWPLVGGIMFVVVNVLISFNFAPEYGVGMFGVGYIVGFLLQVSVQLLLLKRYIILNWVRVLKDFWKIFISSFVMGVCVFVLKSFLVEDGFLGFGQFVLAILSGVLIYGLMITLIGVLKYTGFEHHIKRLIKYV